MQSFSANQAKQELGRVLDTVQREPVLINRHNRPAAVVLSVEEFDRLRGLNVAQFSAFCDQVGNRAVSLGLDEEKLSDLLSGK